MFRLLPLLGFQKSETDGSAVMMVELGEKPAAVPIRSVAREFGISAESVDGRMLALIEQALEFVQVIRLGDVLPAEVTSGEASWEPGDTHRAIAAARLKVQLVDWLNQKSEAAAREDPLSLVSLVDTPNMRQSIQEAMEGAATALGVANGRAVLAMIDDIADELSYIEALRERLLFRAQSMDRKLNQTGPSRRSDSDSFTVFTQVQRLLARAIQRLQDRFDEVDGQAGEILAALRHMEGQKTFIRTNRDWLYRTLRAWDEMLCAWDELPNPPGAAMRPLLQPAYRFLAPRFMPVTEWLAAANAPKKSEPAAMVW